MNKIKLYIILFLISYSTIIKAQDSLRISKIPIISKNQSFELISDINLINNQQFNFQLRPIKDKIWRSFGYSFIYNVSMGLFLVVMPDDITQWHRDDKFQLPIMLAQYKQSFTKTPVIDNDLWTVNYLGHPYQGAYYFNSMRSQGATFWQSTLYNFGQSMLWEYVWEGGLEQPSIQDMIVTPVLGSLVGELSHKATLAMRKKGFNWYEKIAVCIINPSYAINNGFRTSNFRK